MLIQVTWCTGYLSAVLVALFITSLLFINAEDLNYSSVVKPPGSWTNLVPTNFSLWELERVRPISINGNFVCGFVCNSEGATACVFAISIFQPFDPNSTFSPRMVWSANRNNPVGLGAKLNLSRGGLTLQNLNGSLVWSTKVASNSVSVLKLTDQGNLVLLDGNNATIWQSFDHPTDSIVPGQRLVSGQMLKASMSAETWREGPYSFSIDANGFSVATYVEADATLTYYQSRDFELRSETGKFYAEINEDFFGTNLVAGPGVSFIRLGYDGHLRSFWWAESNWLESEDMLESQVGRCGYPTVCGKYGICSEGGCSCPDWFRYINSSQQDLGCSPYIPVSCESLHQHSLFKLKSIVDYSELYLPSSSRMNEESCKLACLKNCSCKYAMFLPSKSSVGRCFLKSHVVSSFHSSRNYSSTSLFIKIQNSTTLDLQKNLSSPISSGRSRQNVRVMLGSTLGAIFGVLIICTLISLHIKKGIPRDDDDDDDEYLCHLSGTPTRFSYEELKIATDNFSNKLGEGGFGCVFKGTLPGGAEVAVKSLDGFGFVKKSFIAEVETIGSIHHFNLVPLAGFCAERSRMLLVYDYMCNGSLDQWIFCENKVTRLGWQCRRKIILDIAKGLAYLHEGCQQKIIHLDIKPQNILLDTNFNAKISDFGLSKLVGREQSQVVTTMRGTPGYMAPEWLSSVITEKADVYSFGIVVLEILCGRKNVDRSQPEEDSHLVSLFKKKGEDGRLLDLVDTCNDEMQSNVPEAVDMMKVAAWCLQGEYVKRPSMSMVLKFLEGKTDNEGDLDYDLSNLPELAGGKTLYTDVAPVTSFTVIPSILSGPR